MRSIPAVTAADALRASVMKAISKLYLEQRPVIRDVMR